VGSIASITWRGYVKVGGYRSPVDPADVVFRAKSIFVDPVVKIDFGADTWFCRKGLRALRAGNATASCIPNSNLEQGYTVCILTMTTVTELREQAKSYVLSGCSILWKPGLIRLITEARVPVF